MTTIESRLRIRKEVELSLGRVQLAQFNHPGATESLFRPDGVFWIDLCLTPRRTRDCGRYVQHWPPHRLVKLGAIIALPPGETLQLRTAGGRRSSLICQLRASAVQRWLADHHELDDHALEICLDVANTAIRSLLLRIATELHTPGVASRELLDAITLQLSIELARHIDAVSGTMKAGGLAPWRLRLLEKRFAKPGAAPSLEELAALCKLSARQLTRAFRTSRGCSIADYMRQVRIETAKRRLAGREPIKEISTSMGFASQSTFTYTFRRATGVTPNQFRTRVLRGGEHNERH